MCDNFKALLTERGLTRYKISKATGVSQGSLSDWVNGKSIPKYESLKKIADYLGVTVEYLRDEEKSGENNGELTVKDRRDIARDLEKMMNELEESGDLMFDGEPATPEAIDSIRQAMAMALEYAKKVNKEKYTPKKYRK